MSKIFNYFENITILLDFEHRRKCFIWLLLIRNENYGKQLLNE